MSFFDELKRRNVFRVGIAYGITAWIVLQVADLVFENIGAPDWMIKSLMFLVVLGFIAAIIIAWAYELTPEGIKKEADVVRDESVTHHTAKKLDSITLAAVFILLGFMIVDRFVLEKRVATPETVAKTVPAPEPQELETTIDDQSIAVLPFVDMSPEGDQAYFADGIAEEILNVLVKTHSLKVAGRTSSFQFRNREEDLRLIGEQLGVANILEGSIRKAGNRLRITAQLVKADDGFHLWSETYDRELTDVFAIQDEIARAITTALAVELNLEDGDESLAQVKTSNMEAYDKYLEARALLAKRSGFTRLISLLEEATELDSQFAEGWATLAQAHALSFYYNVASREVALGRAEPIARHAIQLDPKLSEAHSALADVLRDKTQWNEAWDSYQAALEFNPDNVEAHLQFSQMLIRVGHHADALRHAERAVELDPLSFINQLYHGLALYQSGQLDASLAAIEKAEVLGNYSRSLTVRFKVRMALSEGLNDMARRTVQGFIDNPDDGNQAEDMYFLELVNFLDDPDKASEWFGQFDMQSNGLPNAEPVLFWLGYFEQYEMAEQWLQAAVEGRTFDRTGKTGRLDGTWIQFKPVFPLMAHPRMKQLFLMAGLDSYWRKHGWPAYCRPVGEVNFECGDPRDKP